jgi:flagellar biosynthesis/type III secretory pathway M-ring protein FliF/YscJ
MTFWEVFIVLMIFVPMVLLWIFTLVDLFQREDLSGVAKALWAIAIVLLPLVGMVIYFIVRDSETPTNTGRPIESPPSTEPAVLPESAESSPGAVDVADQLERLADLRDKSILTDEEFQREKDKLLGFDST